MPLTRLMRRARPVFSDLTPEVAPSGWATSAMLKSIQQIVFVMMAGWQLVMVVTTFTALGTGAWPLIVAQAGLAVCALIARHRRPFESVLPFVMIALGLFGYIVGADIDSLMVFAASWQINFGSCAAALLILRPIVVPSVIVAGAAVATMVAIALPDWGVPTAISIGVTQAAIVIALRLGLPSLLRIAADTDEAVVAADAARTHAALVRGVTLESAEQARVLHDTAINTLAAVAIGGSAVRDEAMVRTQCARDVVLLEALRAEVPLQQTQRLRDVFLVPGLPIRRSGLTDAALQELEDRLPAPMITAAVGCVRECVTNATKHSGAAAVSIDVSDVDGAIVITVSDDGTGFDVASATERGISASIRARAAEHGIGVELTSAATEGTRVVLTLPMDIDVAGTMEAAPPSTDGLQNGAARLWGIGVAVVSGVLMLAGGTNTGYALIPMILLMLLAVAVTRVPMLVRARRTLAVALAVTTLVVFILSAAAVDFGRTGPIHWQALAATGPFVQFLSLGLTQRAVRIGLAAWAATVVVLSVAVWPDDAVAAQITLVAGAVGLGFSAVWLRLHAAAARYATEAARLLQTAFAANLSAELDVATRQTYRGWSGAGLDTATDLLHAIADGARSPRDPAVREACGDEEQYLRQLLQVSPALILLGPRLLPSLRVARERGVSFTMRIGDVDARDDVTADHISDTVIQVIANTPMGATCSATIFPIGDDLQLTVITPSALPSTTPSSSEHRVITAGTLTIAEYVYPAAIPGERTSAALTSGSTR